MSPPLEPGLSLELARNQQDETNEGTDILGQRRDHAASACFSWALALRAARHKARSLSIPNTILERPHVGIQANGQLSPQKTTL